MGWCVKLDVDDEIWYDTHEFDTKEEAIKYGIQQYKDFLIDVMEDASMYGYSPCVPSSLFEVGEKSSFAPHIDVDMILDDVVEQATWQCGEIADDWLSWDTITKAQEEELQNNMQNVFDEWLKKHHLEPTFYNVINIEEIDAKKLCMGVICCNK